MMTDPTPEHRWLMQLVGEWEYESTCDMGPDGERGTGSGREVVRAIGDLWVMGEMVGEMPGAGQMTGIITLGFNPARQRFIGSWIGGPMAHMFIYDGVRDEAGSVLTLDCEGPGIKDPATTCRYRDSIEVVSSGTRREWSQYQDDEGEWHTFFENILRRVG